MIIYVKGEDKENDKERKREKKNVFECVHVCVCVKKMGRWHTEIMRTNRRRR